VKVSDNFKKGSVEMLVLLLLTEEDLYGYQISQLIEERSNDRLKIPEGSLYPCFYKLVEKGYISDTKKQVGKRLTRVYYHLEPSGLKRLQDLTKEYFLMHDTICSIFEKSSGGEELLSAYRSGDK